jgi:hypothetical protein
METFKTFVKTASPAVLATIVLLQNSHVLSGTVSALLQALVAALSA